MEKAVKELIKCWTEEEERTSVGYYCSSWAGIHTCRYELEDHVQMDLRYYE